VIFIVENKPSLSLYLITSSVFIADKYACIHRLSQIRVTDI